MRIGARCGWKTCEQPCRESKTIAVVSSRFRFSARTRNTKKGIALIAGCCLSLGIRKEESRADTYGAGECSSASPVPIVRGGSDWGRGRGTRTLLLLYEYKYGRESVDSSLIRESVISEVRLIY